VAKQKNTENKKLHSRLMGQKKNRKQAAKESNRQRLRELNQLANKLRNENNKELVPPDMENNQVHYVSNFEDFVATPFTREMNAVCWNRELKGDFSEIVDKVETAENITTLEPEDLLALELSEQGQLAREILLNDLKLMESLGASPVLNIIKQYERDDSYSFFPTDVYSFHVDRSPIPVDTILCTYYGDSSEIVPNSQAEQKIAVPEIRHELRKLYEGSDEGFEAFLSEHFFDLHYQVKPHAAITNLGIGHLWKLATDHPDNKSLPCVHRAPVEKSGKSRLLLIC
jgi:hypothetical protein